MELASNGWSNGGLPADMILRNGKIVTMDGSDSVAQALEIKGQRIAAVGKDREISRTAGKGAIEIDLDRKVVLPGRVGLSKIRPIKSPLADHRFPGPYYEERKFK